MNEIIGLMVVVAAALLLLSLVSYTPTDPSFDTVGSYLKGRPAHNWTGMVGAWLADGLLQVVGVAVFLLPVVLARLGVSWMRSMPAGSPVAKSVGLGIWVVFAPAAIALLPGALLWRHALPIEGVIGRLVADAMVEYLNLPGTCIVVAMMVALSLYLATTFTFNTAREWAATRFEVVRRLMEWWAAMTSSRKDGRERVSEAEEFQGYESKRERALAKARREEAKARPISVDEPERTTLLGGLFWLVGSAEGAWLRGG